MDDLEQDFYDLIQTEFNPETVGYGEGWTVARLMDDVYEVTCTGDTTAQIEATIFLKKKLRINFKRVLTTPAYFMPDGRVAVCYLKKAKRV